MPPPPPPVPPTPTSSDDRIPSDQPDPALSKRPSVLAHFNDATTSRVAPLSRLFVNHTNKTCAVSCFLPILAIVIIIASRSFSLDDPSAADYFIRNDERTRLDDARAALLRDFPYDSPSDDSSAADRSANLTQQEEETSFTMYVLMRGKDEQSGRMGTLEDFSSAANVLTREAFILHKEAEDAIINHSQYSDFCLKDLNALDCQNNVRTCVLPTSFLNHPLLFGVLASDNSTVCDRRAGTDLKQENFDAFVDYLVSDDADDFILSFFSTNISRTDRSSWTAQSYISMGLPLPGFNDPDDRYNDQEKKYLDWAEVVAEDADDLTTDTYDVLALSPELGNSQFSNIALRDLSFSVAAIVIVFFIIWIHTSSPFLSATSMLQIILSFPLAYLIYHFILRQLYFGSLQLLTIFLLLGIGADDVFVFTDAWKQAAVVLGPDVSLITRMNWTYRRAVRAMTVTSFTTAAAFFVTATSPIMPISTLGVWAGLLILVQFLFVITIYPCAVVIWHRFWRPRFFVRCFQRANDEDVEREAATPLWYRCLPMSRRPEVRSAASGDYRAVERFFRGPWFRFIQKTRFALIALAAILVGLGIWQATGLEPPASSEEFLPSDHPVRVAFRTLEDGFPRSDEELQLRVRVSWGIEDVDRSGTSRYEPDKEGTAVLDDTFDLTKKEVQEHILFACGRFNSSGLLFDLKTIEPTQCWIVDYKEWREEVEGKNDFETFSSQKALVDELIRFGEYTKEDQTRPYLKYLQRSHIVFNENRTEVLMTEIRFVSDTEAFLPYRLMWPVYTKWQDLLEEVNKEAPGGANKAIATGGFSWKWQMTQRTLVRSMFTGIGVMLVVALVTLMVATLNWTVAILAIVSIGGVVAMLLGIIRLLGWELGISESVGVVISIGYSFDGAAHIATAYIESKSKSRADKTRDALTDLGISILFGVVTTLGAGLMLFPAIITFFVKFAGLIVSTVTLSLIWSLGFFPAILSVCGPEGNFGSVTAIGRFLFGRRRKNETAPAEGAARADEEEAGVTGIDASDNSFPVPGGASNGEERA